MSVKELFDLSGKTALITGGSRGLGLQIAEAFGELGVKVAITARKQGELDEAAAQLSKQGVETLTIAGDLSKFETIPAMVDKAVARYGTIDILVNNAGTAGGVAQGDEPERERDVLPHTGGWPPLHDSAPEGEGHQHVLGRRPARSRQWDDDHRLQHQQGGGAPVHARAGGGVGEVRHQRERTLPRVLSLQDVARVVGGDRRRRDRSYAAGA